MVTHRVSTLGRLVIGQAWLARFALCLAIAFLTPTQALTHSGGANRKSQPAHKSSTAPPAKKSARPASTLKTVEDALARTRDKSEARALQARAQSLRISSLSPATFLLVRHGKSLQEQNNLADAEHEISSALTLQPDKAILWRFRAAIRAQGQDADGAIADLGMALQLDPQDAEAWQLLSQIEIQRGRTAAALKAGRKARDCAPALHAEHANPSDDAPQKRPLKL